MKQHESTLQKSCVKWFKLQYPKEIIFAVPNGSSRNLLEAVRLKAEGTLAGVSDLIVIFPNKILFIELKYGKGKQTEHQLLFEQKIKSKGFDYYLINSFESFKELITKFA